MKALKFVFCSILLFFLVCGFVSYISPSDILATGSTSNVICGTDGINTAIGCIPTGDPQAFTSFLLRWGIGIGGGIAMLLIIYSGFLIMTSSGDPRKMQAGKELLTAAIGGIIFLAASTYILNIVGVEILKIPGL